MIKIYIKAGILSVMLFMASYFLTKLIYLPIHTQKYFGITFQYSVQLIGFMLLLTFLFSLTIGIWSTWRQYLFVALPPILGLTLVTAQINFFYAAIVSIVLYVLLCLDISGANTLKNTLIKFRPQYALRASINGLLFIFSVAGGVMIILSSDKLPKVNFSQTIAQLVEPHVEKLVTNQLQAQLPGISFNLTEHLNFTSVVEEQVSTFIGPYMSFFHPILAVLMFMLFQFYASIAKLIFSFTIGPLFWLAKKVGFLHIEKLMVEKEELKF